MIEISCEKVIPLLRSSLMSIDIGWKLFALVLVYLVGRAIPFILRWERKKEGSLGYPVDRGVPLRENRHD